MLATTRELKVTGRVHGLGRRMNYWGDKVCQYPHHLSRQCTIVHDMMDQLSDTSHPWPTTKISIMSSHLQSPPFCRVDKTMSQSIDLPISKRFSHVTVCKNDSVIVCNVASITKLFWRWFLIYCVCMACETWRFKAAFTKPHSGPNVFNSLNWHIFL